MKEECLGSYVQKRLGKLAFWGNIVPELNLDGVKVELVRRSLLVQEHHCVIVEVGGVGESFSANRHP